MARGLGWSRKLPKRPGTRQVGRPSQDVQDVVGPGFWEGPPPTADTGLLAVLFPSHFLSPQHRLPVVAGFGSH